MQRPRIQVLLDEAELTPVIRGALEQLGAEVDLHPLVPAAGYSGTRPVDARLVVADDLGTVTGGKLNQLYQWFDRDPCATLVVSEMPMMPGVVRDADSNARAIGYASNVSREDLAGRLSAMCGFRRAMDASRRELETLRRRDEGLRAEIRRVGHELQTAGALQRDLLPSTLPEAEGLELSTLYRPAEVVSGDMYDVVRLDDSHVAVSLIDATGHGLAAALLCASVQRLFDVRRDVDRARRPLEPEEVLAHLNRELLATQLSECQFVAALHAVYDEKTRVVRWARGGMPYPILVRPGEGTRQIASEGSIVGACAEARFESVELRLEPGDSLVFHSDGLDALFLSRRGGQGLGNLNQSGWFRALEHRSTARNLDEIDQRLSAIRREDWDVDDITVVALHVLDQAASIPWTAEGTSAAGLCASGLSRSSRLDPPAFEPSVLPPQGV